MSLVCAPSSISATCDLSEAGNVESLHVVPQTLQLADLPNEILVEIFLYFVPSPWVINREDVDSHFWPRQSLILALCCRRWHSLVMIHNDALFWHPYSIVVRHTWIQDSNVTVDNRTQAIRQNAKGRHRMGTVDRNAITIPLPDNVSEWQTKPYREQVADICMKRKQIYQELLLWERKRSRVAHCIYSFLLSMDLTILLLMIWVFINIAAFFVLVTIQEIIVRRSSTISYERKQFFSHLVFMPLWLNILLLPPLILRAIIWTVRAKNLVLPLYLFTLTIFASFGYAWFVMIYAKTVLIPATPSSMTYVPWTLVFLPIFMLLPTAPFYVVLLCVFHIRVGNIVTSFDKAKVSFAGGIALWNTLPLTVFMGLLLAHLEHPQGLPLAWIFLPMYILESSNIIVALVFAAVFRDRISPLGHFSLVCFISAQTTLAVSHVICTLLDSIAIATSTLVLPLVCIGMPFAAVAFKYMRKTI